MFIKKENFRQTNSVRFLLLNVQVCVIFVQFQEELWYVHCSAMAVAASKWKYKLSYEQYCGGVIAIGRKYLNF